MFVTLIAHTQVACTGGTPNSSKWMEWASPGDPVVTEADHLAEFAGRVCYQSFNRPNPSTAPNLNYLANIQNQMHFSVLEHASATFYIEGVSRSLTHELVRHRHLSFSQLSQRYVGPEGGWFDVVYPPALLEDKNVPWDYDAAVGAARVAYHAVYRYLRDTKGLGVKQAREAARSITPAMAETRILVTGNHRAWREFLFKRASPAADAEIRQLAQELLRQLRQLAPNTYQDFPGLDDRAVSLGADGDS
jgi:thymidylate synthase (FAD)